MEDKMISLVLTHLQPYYGKHGGFKAAKAVRKYISKHNVLDVYQLIHYPPREETPIIDEGEIFKSSLGEMPDGLVKILKNDKKKGHEIILAGGAQWMCLANTFDQLTKLEISPKILWEGAFPRYPYGMKLYEKYVSRTGKYVFL